MSKPRNKASRRKSVAIAAILLALTVAALWWARSRGIGFDFGSFAEQIRHVAWWHIAAGVALIYASYFLRSYRWAIFLRAQRDVGPLFTLGPQFTGFTAVALFGRIADLSRPYLIARKTRLSLPSQIAVYTIERMFDLGAAALIFSVALQLIPSSMPHHEIFVHVGLISLSLMLALAAFTIAISVSGARIASFSGDAVARISPNAKPLVVSKVLAFRDGLQGIRSAKDALWIGLLSVIQWLLIAYSYVETAHAFAAEPTLAHLSFASTMLLMGASIGSSVLQLPVVGWLTQIGATAASMRGFYGTPLEVATACGALLLFVNLLSIVPTGLVFARTDGVSLTDLKDKSEATEETLA